MARPGRSLARRWRLALGPLVALLAAAGCGSRSPLDLLRFHEVNPPASGGAGGADAGAKDASPDAPAEAGPGDGGPPDAGPKDAAPDVEPKDASPDAEPKDAEPPEPGSFMCLWAKRFGDPLKQHLIRLALTPSGTLLVGGSFYGSIHLGGGTLQSKMVNQDLFVAEMDLDGGHIWSKTFTKKGLGGYVGGLAADAQGSIYLATYYDGSLDFGGGPLESSGQIDVALARLAPDGSHLWSHIHGGDGEQRVNWMGIDAQGNGYYLGDFQEHIDLGGGIFDNPKVDQRDMYVLALNKDGKHLWSHHLRTTQGGEASAGVNDAAGNLTLVGAFGGAVDLAGTTLEADGPQHFWARFGPDGGLSTSKVFSGAHDPQRMGLALTPSGDSLLTLSFKGTLGLGGEPLHNTTADSDLFVGRIGPDGAQVFAERFGDAAFQGSSVVASSPSGETLVAGAMKGVMDLGGVSLSVNPKEESRGFLARFSPSGQAMNALLFGGKGPHTVRDMVALPSGDVIVAGSFSGSLDLGLGALESAGDQDLFMARCRPVE